MVSEASKPHSVRCAGAIRTQCRAAQLSEEQTAQRIRTHCGVSALRAWRLACGLTLQETAALIRRQATEAGEPVPLVTHQRVSAWERGEDVPSLRYLNALCRAFGTRPDLLGFGSDYGTTHPTARTAPVRSPCRPLTAHPATREDDSDMKRRNLLRSAAAIGVAPMVFDRITDIRERMSDLFGVSGLSREALECWEETAEQHGLDYRAIPAGQHLLRVAEDFEQVGAALAAPQGLMARNRLHRVAAQLACVAGVLLIDLEKEHEARAWFRTAALAAAETGDRPLQAWIRTREALVAFYYGSPQAAVRLAESAVTLSEGTRKTAAAMAPAVLARARALSGDRAGAITALRQARDRYQMTRTGASGLYVFADRKLAFYEGEVLGRVGDARVAVAAQQEALRLYGRSERIDPALVWISRGNTLIRMGEVDEGMRVLLQATQPLSTEELHGTVLAAVHDVMACVPHGQTARYSVQEVRDFLHSAASGS